MDESPDRPDVILAGRGVRFVAVFLDNLISLAAVLPGMILFFTGLNNQPRTELPVLAIILMAIGIIGITIYQWYLLARDGQTLGKKALNIRIIRYDNHEYPGFGRAVGLRVLVNGLIGAVPYLGSIYALVNILFIFGTERRCIHDLIAGTIVVEAG